MPQVVGFLGGALGIGAASGVAGFAAGTAFAGTILGKVAINLLASVALSALSQALVKKPVPPGIRTDTTLRGGINPEGWVIGRYATAGAMVAPPMSHGEAGRTPNAYLNYVIELGGIPGQELQQLILEGELVEILDDNPHADYGKRIGGRFEGHAWIRYYDGSQTAADPMLMAKYPPPHVRPWTADMIGQGINYAVLTFRFNQEVFQGWPAPRFVLGGIPLYDPRKDSTAGGSGPHRWGQVATYGPSENLALQIYNILRGIHLPGGDIWGGDIPAEDLPLPVWIAAMDACDLPVHNGVDGLEPQFRGGLEIMADDEPFAVIEELAKAGGLALAEDAGVWLIRVGGPGLPVLFISDDDILADSAAEYRPFPPPDALYNAIEASHPDPDALWQPNEVPGVYNTDWEAEDGGRRLTTTLSVPAVIYGTQLMRVMRSLIADHRRLRVHVLPLPQDAAPLELLDTIAWTSAENFYEAKLFEVRGIERDFFSGQVRVTLREVDPDDFGPFPDLVRPAPPDASPLLPAVQAVPGFAVAPFTITDGDSAPRRPGVRISWDPEGAEDARGIRWAVRLQGETGPGEESPQHDIRAGEAIEERLPATAYQYRARLIVDRPTEWTSWLTAVTPDVRLGPDDLDEDLWSWIADLFADAGLQPPRIVDELPLTGEEDELVWLRSESRLYRWNGSAWVTLEIAPEDLTGKVELSAFTQGIRPVEIVEELPASDNDEGRTVVLTTDGKLYRFHDGDWTAAVASSDIAGQLTNAQIAALEAAKLTGQITQTQITDGAISTSKLAATAVTADKLAASAVVADKIAANAVTAAKIQSGAVTADKVAANSVTADKLAANAVTAGKIAAGAVSASEIAAGAIVASRLAVGDITNLVGTADMTDEDYWIKPVGVSFADAGGAWQSARIVRLQGDAGSWLTSNGRTFEVEPGSSLFLSYNARVVAGSGSVFAQVQTSASADFSDPSFFTVGTVTSTSITNRAGTITVPAGHRYARARLVKGNDGTTDCFIGKVVCRVAAGGELIVDGAITADKIAAGTITGDRLVAGTITGGLLAASGIITTAAQINNAVITNAKIADAAVTNAKISGAIQSDNFASGSTGWQINKNGNAQFNNLIVRGSLVVGAVSDIEQQYLSSDYRWTNTGWTQRSSILLGPVSPTDLWQMHFAAQMRRLASGSDWINAEITVERRVLLGGVWQSWNSVAYHNNNWTTNWHHYNEGEAISGDYENVQYRVIQKVQWNGDVAGNNYRRIALSARKITR